MRRIGLTARLVLGVLSVGASHASAQQTTTYTYDALGRVTAVAQTGGPASGNGTTYHYDPAGNRTNYVASLNAGISIASASANEGSPLSFTVTRSGTTGNVATVNYATSNGTGIAGTNYTTTTGTLSFAAGVTTQTITVPTIDDHLYSGSLGITVTLLSPSSGAVLNTGSATGTIVNIDGQPSLSIAAASANEGSTLTFTVTRSGATNSAVGVSYTTANGTAIAGTNYTATTGTLAFASGVTSQTITVPTIKTSSQTANLAMSVALSSPTGGAAISASTATGTINYVKSTWTSTLTAGSLARCPHGDCIALLSGYSVSSFGSLSSTSYNGYTVTVVDNNTGTTYPNGLTSFTLSGSVTPPNSGWTSISIPGVGVLTRANATYSSTSTTATWTWPGAYTVTNGTVTVQ